MKQLKIDEKQWIERAVNKELSKLEIRKLLQNASYPPETIEEMLFYYESLLEPVEGKLTKKEKEEQKKEEVTFEKSVKSYLETGGKDLKWGEKRQVKRFLKSVEQYSKVMKVAIERLRKEIEVINKASFDISKIEKEIEYMKGEIIDRLLDSKSILEIEHPKTGEEITKDNLKTLSVNDLIEMMEENVRTLDLVVNGKVTE